MKIQSDAAKWLNLEDTMLSETTKPKQTNAVGFTYLRHLKKSHSQRQKVEWWLPVVVVMGKQGVIVQGHGVSELQDWRSDIQQGDYAKHY